MDQLELVRRPPDLERQLEELVSQIPRRRVVTCGDLARALGDVRAARWVGHWLAHHRHRPGCPCHRVVRADGSLGGYITGRVEEKLQQLAAEQVPLAGDRVLLHSARWTGLQGRRPLADLRRLQQQLKSRLKLQSERTDWQRVAGLDVAYDERGWAAGAYVLLQLPSLQQLWQATTRMPAPFPYISSYLAFRELPVLLDLVDQARRCGQLADVLMVDGSGVMHPGGAGIASHLGAVLDMPTVGVTKKLLCGQGPWRSLEPGDSCSIRYEDRTVGVAIRHRPKSRRPLFVSPGHRVSVEDAELLVRTTLAGRRLPEPLWLADRLSRAVATGKGG